MRNTLILGDSAIELSKLPANFLPLTVTSPPYDNLRTDYPALDWGKFQKIAKQLYRVTTPGGVVCWNVQEAILDREESGTASRQRLYFRKVGFKLHQTLLAVTNGFRTNDTTRYYRNWSYVFVLSKGRPRTLNLIHDRTNSTGGTIGHGSHRNRDGSYRTIKPWLVAEKGKRSAVWNHITGGSNVTKEDFVRGHSGLMPESLADDLIRSYSNAGDLVLDPFSGAGTTAKMARLLGRAYLGIEIVPKFHDLATKRVASAEAELRQRLDRWLAG